MQQAIGPLPLALDLAPIGDLEVVPALLLQARPDPRLEQHRIEGLGQVVLGAELDAAEHAVELVEGRDHDHRQVAKRGVGLDLPEHAIAVELRHHDVEQDEIDRLLGQHPQGRRAVESRDRIVAEQLQLLLEQVDVQGLIVGDQNPRPRPFEIRRHG